MLANDRHHNHHGHITHIFVYINQMLNIGSHLDVQKSMVWYTQQSICTSVNHPPILEIVYQPRNPARNIYEWQHPNNNNGRE